MFGLIVKFVTHDGQRDAFIRIMSSGMRDMRGCHSYILAKDPADEVSVWVTEIWDSADSHDVALTLHPIPAVIAEAKPLMARRDSRVVTIPIAGEGL